MLGVLFTQDSDAEGLLCSASSGSEPSLFFSNYLFGLGLNLLGFKLIAANLQHDFAPLTNEADGSVVRQSCRIPFFEC